MIKISRDDVLELGKIANISVSEEEIPVLVHNLQAMLSYAENLKQISERFKGHTMPKNVNIVREDEVHPTPAEPLLKLAPEREENYFVVPTILKN